MTVEMDALKVVAAAPPGARHLLVSALAAPDRGAPVLAVTATGREAEDLQAARPGAAQLEAGHDRLADPVPGAGNMQSPAPGCGSVDTQAIIGSEEQVHWVPGRVHGAGSDSSVL